LDLKVSRNEPHTSKTTFITMTLSITILTMKPLSITIFSKIKSV